MKTKKIHFDNSGNWIWIGILLLSMVLIISGSFELLEFENPKYNNRISAIGFILQVIFYSKMFWYKNYVQWNKKGIVIKFNYFTSKSFRFDDIKTTQLEEKKLNITKLNGNTTSFDIETIEESDTQKLHKIIEKHIHSFNFK